MRSGLRRGLRYCWIAAGLSFTAWIILGFQAVDVPADVVQSDETVTVQATEDGLKFRPRRANGQSGVIFLPGGMVEPLAYAPLMRRLAKAGHPAHLLYLPMRCACTGAQTRELFQRIRRQVESEPDFAWTLAGHSRGGMLASRFARESSTPLAGLVLIGTTHPRDFSLTDLTIPVTKVYGTADGVASYGKMRANQHLLPQNTTWVPIPGANHVQFGYYRHQLGDDAATISREEQQRLLAAAVLTALSPANKRPRH